MAQDTEPETATARWLSGIDEESLVIVELGAGMAITIGSVGQT